MTHNRRTASIIPHATCLDTSALYSPSISTSPARSLYPFLFPLLLTSHLTAVPDHRVEGMPALSPTMEAGNLAGWSVAVGDEISEGQALAQVETDKVSSPFPSYCLMRVVFATYNSGRDDHLIPCGIIYGWREREKERTREREREEMRDLLFSASHLRLTCFSIRISYLTAPPLQ